MAFLKQHLDFILAVICGLCWVLTYMLIILRSWKDKTYGMPFLALAFNISWELIFATFIIDRHKPLIFLFSRICIGFDLCILGLYFWYGRKDWPRQLGRKWFYPYSILVLVMSFTFVYLMSVELHDSYGQYVAYTQNLMMSLLFINMLNKRDSLCGQSVGIAFFKLVGTLAGTVLVRWSPFLLSTGMSCFIFDMVYLVMVLYRHPSTASYFRRFNLPVSN